MSVSEAAYWNSKYSQFYLTRYSPISYQHVAVGKPRATIEEALRAAEKLDAKGGRHMTFIDVVRPIYRAEGRTP